MSDEPQVNSFSNAVEMLCAANDAVHGKLSGTYRYNDAYIKIEDGVVLQYHLNRSQREHWKELSGCKNA